MELKGRKFRLSSDLLEITNDPEDDLIFTISDVQEDKGIVEVSWETPFGEKDSVTYSIIDVEEFFHEGNWIFVE